MTTGDVKQPVNPTHAEDQESSAADGQAAKAEVSTGFAGRIGTPSFSQYVAESAVVRVDACVGLVGAESTLGTI